MISLKALKKSATKGDKKKKKEITETISKLEKDLEEKHKAELDNFDQLNREAKTDRYESSELYLCCKSSHINRMVHAANPLFLYCNFINFH